MFMIWLARISFSGMAVVYGLILYFIIATLKSPDSAWRKLYTCVVWAVIAGIVLWIMVLCGAALVGVDMLL